ncbi:TonB-dependent receptor plug domain-containing protein [Elstera cyanobacteriorum]|uniref:TonB-dependent receptor plug domain-containing protein n=1 Tax=Elstera cyanobacteriorum TaxID=2022747 RepID=UPI0023531B38|nr:TonB-dependent receptor [Elstera cyanobacteriorum]MCK6442612.1 TonB-dependent receptor [Elstera cyanobacteriorum]
MRPTYRALITTALAALTLPAWGQGIGTPPADSVTVLEPVNVTAQRLPSRSAETGSAVTVITPTEIEKRGSVEVLDLLKRAPGVAVARNGGFGATANLRIRGSDVGQVLVLIDGVRVNDAADASAAYDFAGLTADSVERIEVLRGPQSALYGNDAMGGVVNIITKKGRGPAKITAMTEAGSYQTFRQQAGISGAQDGFDYALTAAHSQTKGFSRIYAGPEKDGAEQASITGRGGYRFNETFRLGVSGGYQHLESDFDPSATRDGPAVATSKKLFGRVDGTATLLDGRFENILSLTASDTDRDYDEPLGFYRTSRYEGQTYGAEYQGNLTLFGQDVLTGGLSTRTDKARTTTNGKAGPRFSQDTNSVFGQYKWKATEAFTVTLGGRYDDVESFGGKGTYRLTGAYRIASTGTTLRASYGTGAKAPTLFQRFDPLYGNRALDLETNKGFDAGIEQEIGKTLTVSAGVFHTRYRNLIQYQGLGYTNIGRATMRGAEFGVTWKPLSDLSLAANYTYLEAEDGSTDQRLPRRPKHTVNLTADYAVTEKWQVGGAMRFVTEQNDNSFSSDKIPPGLIFDARTAYQVMPWAQVYLRADNLFDADGRESARYRAPGRSVFAGVKAEF